MAKNTFVKRVTKVIFVLGRGLAGIATEIGYTISVMLAAFLICVILTSL